MPPKGATAVKRSKKETTLALAPQCWFNKTDQPAVLLLLLVRKKCRKSPFYYRKMAEDVFRTIVAFIPDEGDIYNLVGRYREVDTAETELMLGEHILLFWKTRRDGFIDSKRAARIYHRFGILYDDDSRAINYYRQAIKCDPERYEAHIDMICRLLDSDDIPAARSHMDTLSKIPDIGIEYKYKLEWTETRALWEEGKRKEAIAALEMLIRRASSESWGKYTKSKVCASLYTTKFWFHIDTEEWKEALDIYKKLDNPSEECMMQYSKCLFLSGSIPQAISIGIAAYADAQSWNPSLCDSISHQLREYTKVLDKKGKPEKIKWYW